MPWFKELNKRRGQMRERIRVERKRNKEFEYKYGEVD